MAGTIYLVTNQLNDKQYVGQTVVDGNDVGHGKLITYAYKKYGKQNFTYDTICSNIDNRNTLNFMERFWIRTFCSQTPNGYNIENGGSGRGKITEEIKQKISKAKRGVKLSEKARESLIGRKLSEEHKINISKGMAGRKLSQESIKKISEGNKGKSVSMETREKLSKLNKGKTLSEETKKKLSEAAKLQWTRQKGNE